MYREGTVIKTDITDQWTIQTKTEMGRKKPTKKQNRKGSRDKIGYKSSINPPSFLEFNISWLAFATSAAAAAAAFAAVAASFAKLGFESIFFTRSFSSSNTTLRIQDFNLGTIEF